MPQLQLQLRNVPSFLLYDTDCSCWHDVDDYDALFCRVLDVLPLMASVNESHARNMNELKRRTDHGVEFPDLHDEVFE